METVDSRVDEVAQEIASWENSRQEKLLRKLVDLNYRRGLKALSKKIQQRLIAEGKVNQSVDEIFAELLEPGRKLLPMTIFDKWISFEI